MKLPKPNKYGTIRRAAVLKLIEAGLIEAKCNFHMTDDYAWDNANDFGKSGWMPARIQKEYVDDWGKIRWDRVEDAINFQKRDFSSAYQTGYARLDKNGEISFSIHSNLNYTLRIKKP